MAGSDVASSNRGVGSEAGSATYWPHESWTHSLTSPRLGFIPSASMIECLNICRLLVNICTARTSRVMGQVPRGQVPAILRNDLTASHSLPSGSC